LPHRPGKSRELQSHELVYAAPSTIDRSITLPRLCPPGESGLCSSKSEETMASAALPAQPRQHARVAQVVDVVAGLVAELAALAWQRRRSISGREERERGQKENLPYPVSLA